VMIERLLLFGATGDLVGRFLLPALAELHEEGKLPDGFRVVGTAREDWDDETFRRHAREHLEQHATGVAAAVREDLVRSLRYRQVDFDDPDTVARAIHASVSDDSSAGPIAAYLALPPRVYAKAITALRAVELSPDSRIAVEKPFGEDLDGAVDLNALLAEVSGEAGEQAVFRVDHVLGMATVQNMLALRLANRVLEPVWNSVHIEEVEILWEETLALEGRAGFYDRAGALKDVMQNHMLQILSLVAMEPPLGPGEKNLSDRKLDVLRSVRPLRSDDMEARTRRARYSAGRLASTGGASGGVVPDYAEEEGVDPERGTETFAEVVLDLDSERWSGTRFVLRAGKALARRRKGVVARFRPIPHRPFGQDTAEPAANELWIGLDGPEDITLHLTGLAAGASPRLVPLMLNAPPPASELPAYSRVLLNILNGDSTLSIRGDEAEQAWRVVTPVLEAWADGQVPLQEYPAGSSGPAPLHDATSRSADPM
jgi:glucose-6-phosphate 1-dehydrogenase